MIVILLVIFIYMPVNLLINGDILQIFCSAYNSLSCDGKDLFTIFIELVHCGTFSAHKYFH